MAANRPLSASAGNSNTNYNPGNQFFQTSATGVGGGGDAEASEFELQRHELLVEVAHSLDNVLANLNKLNRNLEQVVAVGHEFSSVEALWSRFEDVMAKNPEAPGAGVAAATTAATADGGGAGAGKNDAAAGARQDEEDDVTMRE